MRTGSNNTVFTYPIKFSNRVVFADYDIKIIDSYNGEHMLRDFTNTSLTIRMSGIHIAELYFLVIGY